ncbi:hypothetical protein JG687_00011829 [Phytophthora cactorum]|uniref:Phytanoyl-CoA dioxygenase n=1 Tax=Phytophthora cactorum TaxID=29920 RepID=A0A329S9D4_9STRA|nr:hypothetical protein Pcac1_g11190 [Phytophthora cactorum]KAG2823006.1 hypothetical protein PC112_g10687 [Phytophthora cactorum]KAG2829664.1 hypothetical protein PC111_g7678 [Phytophthora cactorum]KAG2857272.1 hypothetical protein PC113_g10840 [Phytophthora cactorum]KAG2904906.1 hypothetical protein PC114_g11715 [Phytophthora cactorum]
MTGFLLCLLLLWKTTLNYYCFEGYAIKANAVTIEIKKGQMFTFRGDLLHAGAAYGGDNLCLPYYICVDGWSSKQMLRRL